MCHATNEKRETTHNGRNGTTKSRKNQNAQKTYKYLEILEANTIKQVDVEKKLERVSQENQKATRDKNYIAESLSKR